MATHHPASTDAPVVPVSSKLTLSAATFDGHHDHLDLDSLEHAYSTVIEALELYSHLDVAEVFVGEEGEYFLPSPDRVRRTDPEWSTTLEVAAAALYREICRRSPRETVPPDPTVAERILAGLRVVGPVAIPRSDYGPDLAARAAASYDDDPPETESELRAAWGDR